MKNYQIKCISHIDCHSIRKSILRPHQSKTVTYDNDCHDKSFHLGVYLKNELLGVVSILFDQNKSYRLRGMAVIKNYQNSGLGKLLVNKAISKLPVNTLLWCNARSHTIGFYQHFGLNQVGEEFEIPAIGPHVKMQLQL